MDLDEGLGEVLRQAWTFSGPRHRVPVIAHAAGVQDHWVVAACPRLGGRADRNEARPAVRGEVSPIREETGRRWSGRIPARPLERPHLLELLVVDLGKSADV